MTGEAEGVIKADVAGRMHTSAGRREGLVAEFDRSGLSGPKFAALVGVKYQTFASWLQKRRLKGAGQVSASGASAPASVDTVKWLEAVVEQRPSSARPVPGGLVLQLPGGVRVEIGDAGQAHWRPH